MGKNESGIYWGRYITDGLVVFLFVFVVFEISVNVVWATDHATSLTQLDYALFTNHTVSLGKASSTPPWTVDDFHYGGQNYSALAPGTAFLALPFMAVGFSLAGSYTAYGPVLFWAGTFVSIMGAVASYFVYKIAGLYFRRATSLLLGLGFGLSTISWPFATYFFQSDVSAMLVLASVYFALKAERADGSAAITALACGLAAGLAFTVDYVDAIVVPILFAFLVIKKSDSMVSSVKAAGAFAMGVLPSLAAIGAYNFAIFGNPFMTTESAYVGQSVFGKFSTPLLYGLALNFSSLSRGVFAFAPLAFLGVVGYVVALRRGVKGDTLLWLTIFLGIVIPYSAWYDPSGGLSFGPRFLVPAIPFLILPAGYVVERARGLGIWVVYALFAAGSVINGMAAFVTAVPPSTAFYVSPFLSYILPNFGAGNFDSVWAVYLGHSWLAGVTLVVSLGVMAPLAWVEAVRRRAERQAG